MDSTTYQIIQPPFTLKFEEMPKAELKDYFRWFQDILPERIAELTSAVKSSRGFEGWQPDFAPESLDALGEWFATQIETRPRTREEIEEFNAQSPYPIELSDRQLTNRTFSLAMDIGMYLSQVLLKNHSLLKWDQPLRAKKFVDYGQPVLIPFHEGKVPFDPVRMIVTLAYGLRNKSRTGESVRVLYDIWSKSIG